MYCKKCGLSFDSHPHGVSYVVLCPECCREVSMMSEYGFGEVYPHNVYLGENKVAEVIREDGRLILKRYQEEDLVLSSRTYPEMIKETRVIIYNWLMGI